MCAEIAASTIDPQTVATNIVALDLSALSVTAQELNSHLKA